MITRQTWDWSRAGKIFYFAIIYSGRRTSEWISETCELEFFWMARWSYDISFLTIVVHIGNILILLTANLIGMRCDSRIFDELLNKIEILFRCYASLQLYFILQIYFLWLFDICELDLYAYSISKVWVF